MIKEHVKEACLLQPNTIYVALQGSQNYNLAYEGSDVDTKTMIVPTLKDIVYAHKPISTTHVRENNEHIDLKDIRLMFECYKKQNINFIETLFSRWWWVHPDYIEEIGLLRANAEIIARMNPYRAVRCMCGMAYEKLHALSAFYPAQAEEVAEYKYSAKQLHHIVRLREFMERYIKGIPYKECLISEKPEELIKLKAEHMDADAAWELADSTMDEIEAMKTAFCERVPDKDDPAAVDLLDNILYSIIEKSLKKELVNDQQRKIY